MACDVVCCVFSCHMDILNFAVSILFILIGRIECTIHDFTVCHDDFTLKPSDGVLKLHTFTWLGFVQYTHVTNGALHPYLAPRVVLIQKQFVLATAIDMLILPKHYKIGKVVFGEYERDESECNLSMQQVKRGRTCPRTYVEMPISKIMLHPEYTKFGTQNSPVIVKLLLPFKSHYMMPICLPSLSERIRRKKMLTVTMVDYVSSVPKAFNLIQMAKTTLKLYTHEDCTRRTKMKFYEVHLSHILCTSGCGVRRGAPIISHTPEGTFELLGLGAGSTICFDDSMRHRFNLDPPFYIDIYPYNSWIINIITARLLPLPLPKHFVQLAGGSSMILLGGYSHSKKKQKTAWRGHSFVAGNKCFKNIQREDYTSIFYTETFSVNTPLPAKMNIHLKISAGVGCIITCARLLLPNQHVSPVVNGIGGYNLSIIFSTDGLPYFFQFSLALSGHNSTGKI